jgi:hypothetical protein
MARPKTIQPLPLSSFSFYSGIMLIEVEVRDETCYLIYRGSHKRDAYDEKLWKVMERVVNDYLSATGKKFVPKIGIIYRALLILLIRLKHGVMEA